MPFGITAVWPAPRFSIPAAPSMKKYIVCMDRFLWKGGGITEINVSDRETLQNFWKNNFLLPGRRLGVRSSRKWFRSMSARRLIRETYGTETFIVDLWIQFAGGIRGAPRIFGLSNFFIQKLQYLLCDSVMVISVYLKQLNIFPFLYSGDQAATSNRNCGDE